MVWLRKFAGVGKMLLALVVVMVLVFTIGHFGLKYGVGVGEVPQFLARTWLLWLVVRWSMYAVSGWFLWKFGKTSALADGENRKQYHRLLRAAIIGAICIEVVVFTRLFGG